MEILWILPPGFVVGVLVFDSLRKVFSDDPMVVRRLLADQPVTMGAAATAIGSMIVWAALTIVGVL
jgi:hypothetical protein